MSNQIPHDGSDDQIEITPEMLAAGAEIIQGQFGEIVTFQPSLGSDVAREVFLAMMGHRPVAAISREAP